MSVPLLAHVNADGDIVRAWLDHYLALGISAFHLVVRGPAEENRELLALRDAYPILIRDAYERPFREREKIRRLNALLDDFRGQWIVVVDGDEFLEVPEASLDATIRALERLGATCLAAPLLQRLRADGSIDTPAVIADPFREFPSCSVSLYRLMGSAAMLSKFPLLRCGPATVIQPGNHWPANGPGSASSPLLGASHHFKWKRTVLERIRQAVETRQTAWEDYAAYLVFLQRNGFRLPLGDAFVYSRRELFRRGLLRRMAWHTPATHRLRRMARRLPGPLGRGARAVQRALRSRRSA